MWSARVPHAAEALQDAIVAAVVPAVGVGADDGDAHQISGRLSDIHAWYSKDWRHLGHRKTGLAPTSPGGTPRPHAMRTFSLSLMPWRQRRGRSEMCTATNCGGGRAEHLGDHGGRTFARIRARACICPASLLPRSACGELAGSTRHSLRRPGNRVGHLGGHRSRAESCEEHLGDHGGRPSAARITSVITEAAPSRGSRAEACISTVVLLSRNACPEIAGWMRRSLQNKSKRSCGTSWRSRRPP